MDFHTLCDPYKENGRTTEGQMKWLLAKNIPKDKVDQAILLVYDELDRGKTFLNGHEFDRYLLDVATNLHQTEMNESVKKLEEFFNTFKDKWREEFKNASKPDVWKRIKAVFKP